MSIVSESNADKRFVVNVGFFQNKPQAWFEVDVPPTIADGGVLIVELSSNETVVFAPGHWSGFSIQDRGPMGEVVTE